MTSSASILVRPLREADLPSASHVMRLAFGTFLGLPEPASFLGDAEFVRTRWRADPAAAFAAEMDGEIVGSNFATNWGSVAFFGPLSIRPDVWDRGLGKRLMEPVMECFRRWGTAHAGLFTFPQSQKHVGLYQSFGFWPHFLTAVMSKPVEPTPLPSPARFSAMSESERQSALRDCRRLTDQIYAGLDVSLEIDAVATQGLGDTVLLRGEDEVLGFAVCHCGPGTEAGGGTCFVKFGAVRPGASARKNLEQLLRACEAMAAERGLSRLVAGVNTARHEAYRLLLDLGWRTDLQGVAMHRPNDPGYNRQGVFVLDDWR